MTNLTIKDFKCFINADISLNRLTVMAGANGLGKSTSIQALLLLRQTIEKYCEINRITGYYEINSENNSEFNIPLNGEYLLMLGNSSLVLNKHSDKSLDFQIEDEDKILTAKYEADINNPQLWLKCITIGKTDDYLPSILMHEFYYLNAERLGPRVQQNMDFYDFLNVGWQGEKTAQVIGQGAGFYKIESNRLFPDSTNPYLEYQVNKWLDYIMPGVKVKVDSFFKSLSSQILLENSFTIGEPTIATNLGFGISYALPIITTGLIAKKNSIFIVENPEAHLHPSAQSKIAQFLCYIANAGVNVIVETHSDHIINGIQLATAKSEISNSLVTINFFDSEIDSIQPIVRPISITNKGELSSWPRGFFDQTQIDFSELFNIRKNV